MIGEKFLPQILTSWDRLQRLLRETIDEAHYHLGHTFERVEEDGSGVVVRGSLSRSPRGEGPEPPLGADRIVGRIENWLVAHHMPVPPDELPEGLSAHEYTRLARLYSVMGRQELALEALSHAPGMTAGSDEPLSDEDKWVRSDRFLRYSRSP